MKKATNKSMSALAKQAARVKIKINKQLDNDTRMENAPFFKKKMEKGEQMIAIAGLPK